MKDSANHANSGFDDISFEDHKSTYNDYSQPTSVVFFGKKGPSYSEVTRDYWSEAILSALTMMKQQIETGINAKWQSEEYLKNVSNMWLEIMKCFGKSSFVKINELDSKIPDPCEYCDFVNV